MSALLDTLKMLWDGIGKKIINTWPPQPHALTLYTVYFL